MATMKTSELKGIC